jgi:hypothetical protein
VLRTGKEAATVGKLIADTLDEETVFKVDVRREVIEVGDAEVAEAEVLVDEE